MSDLVTVAAILGGVYTVVQFGDRLWRPNGKAADTHAATSIRQLTEATVRLLDSQADMNKTLAEVARQQALHAQAADFRHAELKAALDKR